MSDKTKRLNAKYRSAMHKRLPWETAYQDCYDYALPGRTSFFQRNKGDDAPEIFDETAVIGTQEFASRIQAGLTPNYGRFFKLEAGVQVPLDQVEEVNKQLEETTNYIAEIINNSNFAQEANECYLDIALGTACMDVFEGDAVHPVIFSAVPLPELAIDTGPRDEIDTYFRTRHMRISHIDKAYPGAKVPADLMQRIGKSSANKEDYDPIVRVVLAVYRDHEIKNEEVNIACLFLPDYNDYEPMLEQTFKGLGSNRFIGFRWSKAAGEAWGRGPLFNSMPAVRVANLVKQMILENAEMSIAGIYTAEDDGVLSIDNIRLLPGTVIPKAPGSDGLQPVQAAGNFDVSQITLQELRSDIRKALYNETLGSPDRTPMSATEVAQRMADLSRQIGSAFGRLQVEFVNRVIVRVAYILQKQGRIELPVINGRQIKILSTSPLSQAQAVEDINAVNNFLSMLNQQFGPQLAQMMIEQEETATYLRERFGVPVKLIRNKQQRQQVAAAIAQMSGEQSGQPTQGAPIV